MNNIKEELHMQGNIQSQNSVIPFQYENHPVRVVVDEQENPWWVTKDVCEALDIERGPRVVERLDEDEVRKTYLIDSLGRKQETSIINESGLYTLILRSNKPQAKPFRKWVTSEMIPSLRGNMNQLTIRNNEVQLVEKNNQIWATSLDIAEKFGRLHKNLLRDIKGLECSESFNRLNFEPVNYVDSKGESRPYYLISRDGFSFLVMGFTGKEAARWKETYIKTFNKMEKYIRSESGKKKAKSSQLPPLTREFRAALSLAKLVGYEGNQAILTANKAVKKITGQDCLEIIDSQKLICEKQEIHLTASDLGKRLGGLSAQQVNKLLESKGLIQSFRDAKNRLHWKPTEEGKEYTVLKDTGKKHGDGTPVQQMMYLESILTVLNVKGMSQNGLQSVS